MKKILLSLGTLIVVGAIVAGATIAFYNDTEVSAGNIFVAGSIDLKVDHTLQTYNGVDCKTCGVTIVSDTSNQVVATVGGSDPIAFPHSAKLVTMTPITSTYWTASIPEASWIWATDPVIQSDVDNDVTYTFEKTFNWMGPISGATIDLGVASDNSYEVFINGTSVAADTNENNHTVVDQIVNIDDNIVQGVNTLKIVVKNWKLPNAPIVNNPGGLLYKLTIDGNCNVDSDFSRQCRLWTEKDLGQGDTFFNFGDVKPADWGTNVISLHVYDNDAYACLIVGNKDDQENVIYDPEAELNDLDTPEGELSQYINVFTWADNGNGLYDVSENSLGSGPLSSLSSIMSMDSDNDQFLVATTTKNIGLAWCAGTLTAVAGQPFSCDGSTMLNDAQSDSFSATLTAYAEQVRNNSGFSCGNVNLPTQEPE